MTPDSKYLTTFTNKTKTYNLKLTKEAINSSEGEKFDFKNSEKLPRIYFYNGGYGSLEKELLPNARDMKSWLADLGYDESKMTFVYDEKNAHNESAWRNIMPEVVTWLFELQ